MSTQPPVTLSPGTSTSVCDYIVVQQLQKIKPARIVDFGAGAGKNGRLARATLGTACQIIAVEGFEETARELTKQGGYDEVDNALLQDWLQRDTRSHGLALFGDVLEHISPGQIHQVIRECLQKFDNIIIVSPLHDLFQEDKCGNPLEIHRAYLMAGFFDRYDPVEKHIVRDDEGTMINVWISSQTKKKPLYRRVLGRVFHWSVLIAQPFGLALVLVRFLRRNFVRFKWLIRD